MKGRCVMKEIFFLETGLILLMLLVIAVYRDKINSIKNEANKIIEIWRDEVNGMSHYVDEAFNVAFKMIREKIQHLPNELVEFGRLLEKYQVMNAEIGFFLSPNFTVDRRTFINGLSVFCKKLTLTDNEINVSEIIALLEKINANLNVREMKFDVKNLEQFLDLRVNCEYNLKKWNTFADSLK
jgi:hypothetical protein